MALDAYVKTCAKNVAGNYNKVFFGHLGDVTTHTLSSTPFEITAMTSTAKFQVYQAEIDSVKFDVKGNGGQNFFSTQTLTLKFAKLSKTLIAAIDALSAAVPCGVLAIHADGNGRAWLSGFDPQAIDKEARPYNKIEVTYDSGLKPSDADMAAVTIVLTRESEYMPTPFDDTLSGTILAGTATGFLAYS